MTYTRVGQNSNANLNIFNHEEIINKVENHEHVEITPATIIYARKELHRTNIALQSIDHDLTSQRQEIDGRNKKTWARYQEWTLKVTNDEQTRILGRKTRLENFIAAYEAWRQSTHQEIVELHAPIKFANNGNVEVPSSLQDQPTWYKLPEHIATNVATISALKEAGLVSRNGEIHIEDPEQIKKIERYADYMYFIDNVSRNWEAQISDITWLMDRYKNLLSEEPSWMWADKVKYLQHKYTYAIHNEIIRRDHIIQKDGKTFNIVKYDGTPAESTPEMQELSRIIARDDVRWGLIEVAMVRSFIDNTPSLDSEKIVSAKELAISIIDEFKIKWRNGQDLQEIDFSLIDWKGNGPYWIWKQVDTILNELEWVDTLARQKLNWFKQFIASGDYKSVSHNKAIFGQASISRQNKITEAALMKSIPKDIKWDADNPMESIAAIAQRVGWDNKGALLVAGLLSLIVAKFVLKTGPAHTIVWGLGLAWILSPFLLAAGGWVLSSMTQGFIDDELDMIEWNEVAPSLGLGRKHQTVFENTINSIEASSATQWKSEMYTKNPLASIWENNPEKRNTILGNLFKGIAGIEDNISLPADGKINTFFTDDVFDKLGWSGESVTVGDNTFTKTQLGAFLVALLEQKNWTDHTLSDLLTTWGDTLNEWYNHLHTITWADKFDDKLNDYMEKAWNSTDGDQERKRYQVEQIQSIVKPATWKFLPSIVVESIQDFKAIFFEEDAMKNIDSLIAYTQNFEGHDYVWVLRDYKTYMEVNNDLMWYKANVFKPSNIESASDAVETVGNNARSLMARALDVSEDWLDLAVNGLLNLGDIWENILRGAGNIAISLVPDWKWAEDAVRTFINDQVEAWKAGAVTGVPTNWVSLNFNTAINALDAPEQQSIRRLIPTFNKTIEKQIVKLEEMMDKLKEGEHPDGVKYPELVEDLKNKVQRELTKVRRLQRSMNMDIAQSAGVIVTSVVDRQETMNQLKNDPSELLKSLKEVQYYFDGGKNDGVYRLDIEDIFNSGNKRKIAIHMEHVMNIKAYHKIFKNQSDASGKEGIIIQIWKVKFAEYLTKMQKDSQLFQEKMKQKESTMLRKLDSMGTGFDNSSNNLGQSAMNQLKEISEHVEKKKILLEISGINSLNTTPISPTQLENKLIDTIKELKTNADIYINSLTVASAFSGKTAEQLAAIEWNLNNIQTIAQISEKYGQVIDTSALGAYMINKQIGNGLFKELAIAYFDTATVWIEADLSRAIHADLSGLKRNTGLQSKLWSDYNVVINRLTTAWGKSITDFEIDYLDIKEGILDPLGINETNVFGQTKGALEALYNKFK